MRFFVDPEELAAGLPSLKGYEFQRRISINELSAVYLARESLKDRAVVLKVLRQVPDHGGEAAFDRFLEAGSHRTVVEIDRSDGVALGVRGTPTFFVNERQLVQLGPDQLKAMIEQELR